MAESIKRVECMQICKICPAYNNRALIYTRKGKKQICHMHICRRALLQRYTYKEGKT